MDAYLLRHTPAVIRLKSCRRKRRQPGRESKKIQGVGGRRYTGEKSGWIGEEWPVAGMPLGPEVPRSLVMDKGGRTARPRPRLRHTPLRPRRPRRHPQEVEARRQGKKGGRGKCQERRGRGGLWQIINKISCCLEFCLND